MLNKLRVQGGIAGGIGIAKNKGRIKNEKPQPVPENSPFEIGFCADQNVFRRQRMEVFYDFIARIPTALTIIWEEYPGDALLQSLMDTAVILPVDGAAYISENVYLRPLKGIPM
jgi:hypothetical protein